MKQHASRPHCSEVLPRHCCVRRSSRRRRRADAGPCHGEPQHREMGRRAAMLPAGAQIAVLAATRARRSYTVRLKFPANYDIPAHSHPTDENVVVVSGALFTGTGTKLDKKAGPGLGVGGFALMPPTSITSRTPGVKPPSCSTDRDRSSSST